MGTEPLNGLAATIAAPHIFASALFGLPWWWSKIRQQWQLTWLSFPLVVAQLMVMPLHSANWDSNKVEHSQETCAAASIQVHKLHSASLWYQLSYGLRWFALHLWHTVMKYIDVPYKHSPFTLHNHFTSQQSHKLSAPKLKFESANHTYKLF